MRRKRPVAKLRLEFLEDRRMMTVTGDYFDHLYESGMDAMSTYDTAAYDTAASVGGSDVDTAYAGMRDAFGSPTGSALPGDATNPYADYAPPESPDTTQYTDQYLPDDGDYESYMAGSLTTPGMDDANSIDAWQDFDYQQLLDELQAQASFDAPSDEYGPSQDTNNESGSGSLEDYVTDQQTPDSPTLEAAEQAQDDLESLSRKHKKAQGQALLTSDWSLSRLRMARLEFKRVWSSFSGDRP